MDSRRWVENEQREREMCIAIIIMRTILGLDADWEIFLETQEADQRDYPSISTTFILYIKQKSGACVKVAMMAMVNCQLDVI